VHSMFYLPDQRGDIDFGAFDYVIDAVDTVAAKIDIIEQAHLAGVPVISAMGCGNRLDPSKLQICDISKTFNDPLSKVMRRRLKDTAVKKLDVVFSSELPYKQESEKAGSAADGSAPKKDPPSSMVFVPACAGLMMAGYVCRKLAGII